MRKIFALLCMLLLGTQELVAGGRNAKIIQSWQSMRAHASIWNRLSPVMRQQKIEELASDMSPGSAIAMQVIFAEEVVAKVRDEFHKNPDQNIKIQIGEDQGEWAPQSVRELLVTAEEVRKYAPEMIEGIGRSGMRRLGIPYEEGQRARQSSLKAIKINGKSVCTKSNTSTYIILGVGVVAIVYGLYSYFFQNPAGNPQDASEGKPA